MPVSRVESNFGWKGHLLRSAATRCDARLECSATYSGTGVPHPAKRSCPRVSVEKSPRSNERGSVPRRLGAGKPSLERNVQFQDWAYHNV